jgi:4-amino-4-deoxy-L-arabinose transferase-like glycosyltransferase
VTAALDAAAPVRDAARDDRSFVWCVIAAAVGGFAIRVVNASVLPKTPFVSDPAFYHLQANLLAKGHGFDDPFAWLLRGRLVPSAVHPPLFPLVLSIVSRFGGTTLFAHRVAAGGIGVVTIVAVAFLARELAGPVVGMIAALFAAVYPGLWGLEGSLMSESLAVALVAVALVLSIRFMRYPRLRFVVLLAVVIGLASLTRPETIVLLPVLALPLVWRRRTLATRRRAVFCLVVVVAAGAVLAPWLARNLTRFSRPVYFSTNGDEVIAVANCRATYYDPRFLGYWFVGCVGPSSEAPDDAARSAIDRRRGLKYLTNHASRFAGSVVWARLGRTFDVYRPFENARYSAGEGRRQDVAKAGLFVYWLSIPFALIGFAWLWRRRRREELFVLLTPFFVAVVTTLYAYGAERFRAIAEPSLIVLATIGLVVCRERVSAANRASKPARSDAVPTDGSRTSLLLSPGREEP